jgi:hypothetical protein
MFPKKDIRNIELELILSFIFLIQPRLLRQPKQLLQVQRHVRDKSSFILESYLFNILIQIATTSTSNTLFNSFS